MLTFYIGCCFGSFLTVVASRLPIGKDFIFSRSCCHHCQRTLKFYELLPLFSLLLLRFRCQRCHQKIPLFYFLSEAIYGSLFLYAIQQTCFSLQIVTLIWLTMAFMLSLTDLFYFIVEPKILYSFGFLLWLVLFYYHWTFYLSTTLVLLLFMLLIYFFFQAYLGFGDVLLLLIWGPWFSLTQLFLLLAIASCSALLFFLGYFLLKRHTLKYLPFIPFLSFGLFAILML